MHYPVKIENISPGLEFYEEVQLLINESKEYLSSYRWCKKIHKGWLFTNIGHAVCIFLYEIENTQSPEDNYLWVMTGDLPAIYLDTYNVKTTKDVIENYIYLVNDWIKHAEAGDSLDECFPFISEVSVSAIEMLKKRSELLTNSILSSIDDLNYKKIGTI
jgi:hypothetical protein